MKKITMVGAVVASFALSGCSNAGDELAIKSRQFAQCMLDGGTGCKVQAPDGTTVKKTSVTETDDAVRVTGAVSTKDECESYAKSKTARNPKYMEQIIINNTVVTPYNDITVTTAVQQACSKPPYEVSLIVAKSF